MPWLAYGELVVQSPSAGLRAGPFDSKRYALLAQGRLRALCYISNFEIRISKTGSGWIDEPYDNKRKGATYQNVIM